MANQMNLTDVLDGMDDKAEGDKLTLGEVVDSFGSRGFGPLLLAVSLIELLPTGAIPGVPTFLAIVVVLLASQLLVGRSSPWIPQKLRNKGFSKDKFAKGRDKVRPFTQKVDKAIKPRLEQFTTPFAARWVAGICVLLAMTMPPLEVIPFASSLPAAAIGLFGIGLSAKDGLLILMGLLVAVCAAAGAVYWLAF